MSEPRTATSNLFCERSRVHPIIDVREKVVPSLDLAEPRFVDVVDLELIIEDVEVEDMHFGALDRVFDHGAGLHDESPVAGLGQQKLAGGLVERASAQGVAAVA